ncbi:MAG: hypothetical protein R2828_29870 [Saprospiraceae bacterium]
MGKNKDINHIEHEMNDIMGQTSPPAIEEAKRLLRIKQNHLSVRKDAYIGDPYSLLGEVIIIRKEGGKCPGKFISENNPEFYELPIQIEINDDSKIKEPVTVSSFIVDKGLSVSVDALKYLSAELDQKSAFSVIVTNQAAGLVKVQADEWRTSLKEWKEENNNLYEDENICYILAVTGFVQKNILRKKYFKLEGNAKGGAFGINLNGKAYTSTEDYALDTIFGLDVRVLKYPSVTFKSDENVQLKDMLDFEPNKEQLKLFETITAIKSN